ncbi:kinetochore protein Spc25 isoform X2 [Rhineura floridana]|uniref:kinetochore protein Spc25 isoform X2 n=1 Tax=Rhineura floridana TaxID=261503 RepID=UPI002AC7F563|nr:kinetochore protein Spc25 isoform X2 [Rhineura floridana]
MAQTNDDELAILEKEIKEFWTKFKTTCCSESIDQTLGLRDLWQESLSKLSEFCQNNKSIEEKQEKLSEVLANIKDGKKEETNLMDSIQELKEELIRKRETESKATEEMVERLHKAEKLFKERLGLEIRKTDVNHLQFIFRCIDHKDLEKPYVLTLSINEEGAYEVISCSPPLDGIEELQQKVRETSNFSAFIANIRKDFIAVTYK